MQKYKYEHFYAPEGRGYLIGNIRYFGVSTILSATKPIGQKMALANWIKSLGDNADVIRQGILDRGTRWHKYLEHRCNNNKKGQEYELQIESNRDIYKHSKALLGRIDKLDIMAVEFPCFSNKYKYAGMFDCLAKKGNEVLLLDWKTANKKKEEKYVEDYYLQLSAYSQAISECYGYKVNRAIICCFYDFAPPDYFELDKEKIEIWFEKFKVRIEEFNELRATSF